ncbi:hypothetical protein DC498_01515 [Terrimonas sp.]|uniref:ORC-CDC6 family AAA ATPase n=1 Tax=Terrimonas sp. TaxID=1914338 RepID=UPI000D5240FA|nr:hypothetical protein [Terrimonas sp.]PVD54095.1 hypothetical protein DC498_01515 [Terrimonas sp.]
MENKLPINPFEFEAAVNFATDELIEYFVEDHNYSRFIQSSRNIFIVGERGCGKSMTLLYNSYQKQLRKAEKENKEFDYSKIGIYIPCTNVLFFKKEYELVNNDFKVSVLSEHFFVLSIAHEMVNVLSLIPNLFDTQKEEEIRSDLKYILNIDVPNGAPIFKGLVKYFQKLSNETQNEINNSDGSFSEKCVSFFSLIIPLIRIVKSIEHLNRLHFLFLIDDAHDLNSYQVKVLNSWIAYRDHTDFSFKVAVAKVRPHMYITATGSSIIEGHDFLKIDMEKPYQNKFSDFGLWAKDIVKRRLEKFGANNTDVYTFFPINPKVESDFISAEQVIRKRAEELYKNQDNAAKKINDYVYKYARAEYFRTRSSKANLPQYSGWETIVHLSTGVVRNLLQPCYWMFDKEVSKLNDENKDPKAISSIRPSYQDEVIKEQSNQLWNKIENDLFNNIDNCSTKQGAEIKNLFEQITLLFKERLLNENSSEPRAITFSISAWSDLTKEQSAEMDEWIRISREALILYDRKSSAKEFGEKETIYIPNRILFPSRGLDVIGQHSRVSIKAKELYDAATKNKKINAKEVTQQTLFDL